MAQFATITGWGKCMPPAVLTNGDIATFLETDDEYFDYAPARLPPQGRWRIYGVALPEQILRKVYNQNAARVLGMKLVGA